MRAVILAGGEGRRLAPYTHVLPKPLMPIGEKPILELVLRQLKHSGFERVTLAVNYLAPLVQALFGTGGELGLRLDYSIEKEPLGTAGCLGPIAELDEPFLVMNGDLLALLDFKALFRYHRENRAVATLATYPRSVQLDLGILQLDDEEKAVIGYTEKPESRYQVSTGIYVLEPEVTRYLAAGEKKDFPTLIGDLLAAGRRVLAYHDVEYWMDIGREEDYRQAAADFEKMKEKFLV